MNTSPQKNVQLQGFIRLLLFLVIPILLIAAANDLLLQTDAHSYYTMLEMTKREDIDLALVGSSVVSYNFDPAIITESTGLETFDVSVGMMSLQGSLAAARLLFENNTPQYVALVLDPMNLTETAESLQTQLRVMPFIQSPIDRLRYYLDLTSQDGKYIERILRFKTMPVTSLADVKKTIEIRTDPQGYYERSSLGEGEVVFRGQGHVHVNLTPRWGMLLSETSLQPYEVSKQKGLFPYSEKKILEFVKLCESHGAKPMVMIAPDLVAHRLAEVGYMDKSAALAEFCRAQGIEFYDFSIPKPEFIPRLDEYYYDLHHMNGEGAEFFSRRFAEFMNLYLKGEPVDHLFYASQQDYLEHIDFITNTWMTCSRQADSTVYTASCNRGPNVIPEYAFLHEAPDGTQTLLRDYQTDSAFTLPDAQAPAEGRIIVTARPQADPNQRAVFYSLPL